MAVFAFVSMMEDVPWGGSEELWSQTAVDLVRRGHTVRASVSGWQPLHPNVVALSAAGLDVVPRERNPSLWKTALRRVVTNRGAHWPDQIALDRFFAKEPLPDLVVVSEGAVLPLVELLGGMPAGVPYAIVSECNGEHWWPDDERVELSLPFVTGAARWWFVSDGNRALAEWQLAASLGNASVVRNPFNVGYEAAPDWPPGDRLSFAVVGRLDPRSKGQDLVIAALAQPQWSDRDWVLNLYGDGPMRHTLERLADWAGLSGRVTFCGHVASIEDVWGSNHVLVQPSRFEGLPLSVVEAMMCGRPVVATDVAGHREVVGDGATGFIAGAPTVASVAVALERCWEAKDRLPEMGALAASRIRELVPRDPAREFADQLLRLVGST